jgi:hypothetical protein
MAYFLYRRGNGNDGNFKRFVVNIAESECPYSALKALVVNDYIPGSATRRHIIRCIFVDGDTEFGINAEVYEDRDGDTEFGASWLTAALEPLDESDAYHVSGDLAQIQTLRECLDMAAWRYYREQAAK